MYVPPLFNPPPPPLSTNGLVAPVASGNSQWIWTVDYKRSRIQGGCRCNPPPFNHPPPSNRYRQMDYSPPWPQWIGAVDRAYYRRSWIQGVGEGRCVCVYVSPLPPILFLHMRLSFVTSRFMKRFRGGKYINLSTDTPILARGYRL